MAPFACLLTLISNNCFDTYNKSIALIDKDIGFLLEDSRKGNKKLQVADDAIADILLHKKLMNALHDYLLFYEEHKNQFSEQFNVQLQKSFKEATSVHNKLIDDRNYYNKITDITVPNFYTASSVELSVLGRLMEYISLLNSVKSG